MYVCRCASIYMGVRCGCDKTDLIVTLVTSVVVQGTGGIVLGWMTSTLDVQFWEFLLGRDPNVQTCIHTNK